MAKKSYVRVKRIADCALTLLSTPLTLPALVLTGLVVRVRLGSPVLFRQERPGLNAIPFEILKFRTMQTVDESRGRVTNEQRMTKVGGVLRSLSLDELPSLLNVLKGDMSLVGPRPLRTSYLPRYSSEQMSRHSVRPGLTGLAQVSGRNALTWDQRLDLDVEYVRSVGMLLDFKILLKTVLKVVRREGIAAKGQATMSEFFGPERTANLALRPLSAGDLSVRIKWLSDPRIRAGITISYWPNEEDMKSWYDSAALDKTRIDYTAVDRTSHHPEVMCGLTDIDGESASLYVYVNPEAHGRGYGTQSMQMLVARARNLGLGSLRLETKAANHRARRMYERLGFKIDSDKSLSEKLVMQLQLNGHNQRPLLTPENEQ